MKRVRKAIIPAAGLGTRFLPATKTVPKEMLPIIDRPTLLYIVEEAVRAGIEDIVLIAGRNKEAIEDFFDCSYELQDKLAKDGKHETVEMLIKIQNMANIISIRQKQAIGLGHAVLCGRPIVGDEPCAVLLGDEIMISGPQQQTVTETLAKSYVATGLSTVAIMEVPENEVSKYGIVGGTMQGDGRLRIQAVVEKPAPTQAPSRWALPGRYVFSAEIFQYLEKTKPGKNGEIQLTDAMVEVAKAHGLLGAPLLARRYDAGDKFGYLQANIEMGLEHPEVAPRLREYLKGLLQRI
ncbi:MAG: UTP--glucose-1-phosphate uridylyltransferase GalU [Bdellovibrionaceae bacterium]|nr:UTP--glucose-1-phosphate uridylyltransferase GalU [Pseudobdellovibrionaceae bacterium]